jgi:ssDNA-binding Zn-finger/Zn-ribbon topoisomerase 1
MNDKTESMGLHNMKLRFGPCPSAGCTGQMRLMRKGKSKRSLTDFGYFLACDRYPRCKRTKGISVETILKSISVYDDFFLEITNIVRSPEFGRAELPKLNQLETRIAEMNEFLFGDSTFGVEYTQWMNLSTTE